ncbi:MAG: hybrid sensor histidine kinase/response regulator [Pseudomonadota bacterium]
MNVQTKLNISSIIGVKEGINQIFSLIDQNLGAYARNPGDNTQIIACRDYIHQLDGLLEMLELNSIAIVSEKMEQVITALIDKKIEPGQQAFDALNQTTKALLYYLNELIDGVEDNPIRLFPAYRDLMYVYGSEKSSDSHIFFPRLIVDPPLKAEIPDVDAIKIKISAKQAGTEYQSGLLKWLRNPAQKDGLRQMGAAIQQIEKFPGAVEHRAFWWITASFLEDLLSQETTIDIGIRRLCGRIEQAIRHLAAGTPGDTSLLTGEILYHIAHSQSGRKHIDAIRRSYQWAGQSTDFPKAAPAPTESETLHPALESMRTTLMGANDIWREFCSGQQESLTSLQENMEQLLQSAALTQCKPLEQLVTAMGGAVTNLRTQPQDLNEELAMEMATALLLTENILDNFNRLPVDLPNQVDSLATRLLTITTGNENDRAPLSTLSPDVAIYKTQTKKLQAQVTQEILLNLEQIEKIIDSFFFEPAGRSELSTLPPLFKQVSGVLIMLDLERANTLLNLCQRIVEKFSDPAFEIPQAEQILLVDGLSSLGFFIEAFKNQQPESEKIIEEAIVLFENTLAIETKPVIPPVSITGIDTKTEAATHSEINPELLDFFLEEANEILTEMTSTLQRCHADPSDTASLTVLRRNFHTLKGSGRMVKLQDIGEVAWSMEQVLNHWLSEKKPTTRELLNLIARSHQAFSKWCQEIRKTGKATIAADDIHRQAQTFLKDRKSAAPIPASDTATASKAKPHKLPSHSAADPIPVKTAQAKPKTSQSIAEIDERLNHELLQVFLEETQDIIPQIGGKLRGWRILPQDEDIQRALLRLLHTLKGSAHMAGALYLGDLIHAMESNVETAFREQSISDPALDKLESEFDIISEQVERLHDIETRETAKHSGKASTLPAAPSRSPALSAEKIEIPQSKTILRINAELIDRLVNDSGEASIMRSRIETQLNNFKQSLQDLTESTSRLHDQLREIEIQAETQIQAHLAQQEDGEQQFDPLEFDRFTRFHELTRLMAESVDDVITVQKSLRITHSVAEEAVTQQALINRQLQQALMQIRAIPFGNFAERYYRIARQVAEDTAKKVHLTIEGDSVEIDRSVLDRINPPLEHLLRNAIAHGIEEPAERVRAGKPETGQVTINLRQEGNEVIITLRDDGRGLDISRIREEALRLGLIKENEVVSNDRLRSLIFVQGLSTTKAVTGIAGRGIGLDIVKNEISSLGGRIIVKSETNKGTAFNIFLPLTLAVAQALLVRAGQQTFAIPTVIVEHIHEFNAESVNSAYQKHKLDFNGRTYAFAHLSHLLGKQDHTPEMKRHNRVLFLHSGTVYLAIHIDELIGNSEITVKNIGPQLAHAPGIEGATITGDGEVIMILNPVKLTQRDDVQKVLTAPRSRSATAHQKKSITIPTVMIVDDSLTVRKVTCRLLEREGCEVVIAKNGMEAIESLRDIVPDVMLIDLEMPKMNGFELIRNIRANPDTAKIPIIIISSRTAEKHQKIANELGVSIFLGKPYKEEELLTHLSGLIKK